MGKITITFEGQEKPAATLEATGTVYFYTSAFSASALDIFFEIQDGASAFVSFSSSLYAINTSGPGVYGRLYKYTSDKMSDVSIERYYNDNTGEYATYGSYLTVDNEYTNITVIYSGEYPASSLSFIVNSETVSALTVNGETVDALTVNGETIG